MKFTWSTLMVRDLEESVRFYEEVIGWKVSSRFPAGPGIEIAFLGEGETKLELICNKDKKDIHVGPDISWGFQVESLDACMRVVREKGIPILAGPIQPNPHTKFFYVSDPDGLKVQFVEVG